MSSESAGTLLGRHFAGQEYKATDASLDEALRLILDYVGVAFAGSRTSSGRIARQFIMEMRGARESAVIGGRGRVPAANAAFANAVAAHSVELDDVDRLALFHHGPPIVSASLAVADKLGSDTAELLEAIVAGCEMMSRVSDAVNPALRDRGFHSTPTCGVFGATVSAGRLLHLSDDTMTNAIGLAGAQASGLMEMYGTSMQKRINVGPSARNGVTAAILASKGFTGADTILDGPRGFGAAFTDRFDPVRLTERLDAPFDLLIDYKPYACARPIHAAIDGALELRAQVAGRLPSVRRIVVWRHPAWADYHVIAKPRTFHEAQVSLPYSVAVALVHGAAMPAQYADPYLNDPEVVRLAGLIEVKADPSLADSLTCRLVVEADNGSFESTITSPRGSGERPMTDADLEQKFMTLAAGVIDETQAKQILSRIHSLKQVSPVRDFTDLLMHRSSDSSPRREAVSGTT